jgi:hypothetical protein
MPGLCSMPLISTPFRPSDVSSKFRVAKLKAIDKCRRDTMRDALTAASGRALRARPSRFSSATEGALVAGATVVLVTGAAGVEVGAIDAAAAAGDDGEDRPRVMERAVMTMSKEGPTRRAYPLGGSLADGGAVPIVDGKGRG